MTTPITAAGEIDALLARLLFIQLRRLGLFEQAHFSLEEQKSHLDALYGRWLEESARVLVRHGHLRLDGGRYTLADVPDAEAVWRAWEAACSERLTDPQRQGQMKLLDATVRALPDILRGKRLATDVLFADASMDRVGDVYQGSSRIDTFNAVVAEGVVAYVEDATEPVRILEIGAGTGGTSAVVFEKLKDHADRMAEYGYTDISKAFLRHAEERYRPHAPYLNCRLFNVENSPEEQGIEGGSYDVVIATNVLHATRNIRRTLRNAKAVLRRNGLLLLNEMSNTKSDLFTHLTFGLTKGWWLFEDDELRVPGTPALLPATWQQVLEAEGFTEVCFPAEEDHALGQQVIVAQSDGIVRRAAGQATKKATPRIEATPQPRTTQAAQPEALKAYVQQQLLERVCESLQLSANEVDFDVALADYGMDSIIGINFVKSVNQALSIDLETTVIFDYSSLTQLVAHILAQYRDVLLAARSAVPAPSDSLEVVERIEPAAPAPAAAAVKGPIAIIGMSGRFARSRNLDELWEHLAHGDDLVETAEQPGYAHGSFLQDIDLFDPLFFNISGAEATCMDPKQRIFLEEAWKALEDAGYAGLKVQGRPCGVYVGCEPGDYKYLFGGSAPAQAMWGNANSVLPARVSYYLDLQGPAIAIDTACSSSLVAAHLACQALWGREIEMALVGGVSLGCMPNPYGGPAAAGMLSPTGRCHTFDARADGFVPGEGAGVVVLKRLDDAVADGDRIHGVIRGSAINQDGATNGITAPSARSQERLERHVYETFGIDPERIEMVEAHGTGTVLGDPIEFAALTRAFRRYTDKKQYCAIGSIKTNLGHCLAASGMAGLFRILLSFQQGKIPPSLHYRAGNPHIDFDNSPFFVNTSLKDWPNRAGAPRCAAISAFGMSGTNAHLVLESYEPASEEAHGGPYYLLAFSAKTEEALQRRARDLAGALNDGSHTWNAQAMSALSYTLLAHRVHFEHRCAVVASDREQAVDLLEQAAAGAKHPDIVRASVARGFEEQSALVEQSNERLRKLPAQRNDAAGYRRSLVALGELYCQGYSFDWAAEYEGLAPRRTSLPAYPFARDRYWVEEAAGGGARGWFVSGSIAVHPLAQRNTSTLEQQRFTSTLTGDEFFLKDHRVHGQPVLPGVAYLEMARAAVMASLEANEEDSSRLQLKSVVWRRPLVVTERQDVHIRLRAQEHGEIEFEIYTGQDVIHVQGRAVWSDVSHQVNSVDLTALRADCTRAIAVERFYAISDSSGMTLGAAHRSLTSMHVGRDSEGRPCVLAQVTLPDAVGKGAEAYYLHPSVLDGALQAPMGLALTEDGENVAARPLLPFALESLEILERSPVEAMVVVRSSATSREVQRLDVDICDRAGRVCVRMRGFTFRSPEAPAAGEHVVAHELSGNEHFLRDHGQLLPGVVYLELARAAAESRRNATVSGIKNVVWRDILAVSEGPVTVSVGVAAADPCTFEVRTDAKLHAQGTVLFGAGEQAPDAVHIDGLRSRLPSAVDGAECDRIIGASHGPSMRAIEWLAHDDREGLAKLVLPREAPRDGVLHPSILHGAVTAAIALGFIQDGRPSQLRFPYALEQVWIHAPTPEIAYVHIRESAGRRGDAVRTYDLAVLDERGRCAIALRGFTAVATNIAQPRSPVVYASPCWEAQPLAEAAAVQPREAPVFVLATADAELHRALQTQWPGAKVEELSGGIEANFVQVLTALKRCIQAKPQRVQPFYVLAGDDSHAHGAWPGLLKTAQMEYPKLQCKVVRYPTDRDSLVRWLRAEIEGASPDVEIRYHGNVREVRRLRELNLRADRSAAELVRAGSVVWITGGMGGLGRLFARHFGAVAGATIVLSGRSPFEKSTQGELEKLRAHGVDAHYLPCDVSDAEQVRRSVETIRQRWGRLSGILHSAGVTRDAYLAQKAPDEARAVLAPKIAGTLALDEATRDVALDFFALFSSLSSAGNPGQSDYAGANSFLDAFAHHRNERVARGERRGHTLSVNWPSWREGGMHVGAERLELNERISGLRPLDTPTGVASLVAALLEKHTQVLVAPGNVEKIRATLLQIPQPVATDPVGDAPEQPLLDGVIRELIQAASSLLKLDVRAIDAQSELSRFGFDSIMFTEFANHLNKHYGLELMPTVFFECSTLALLGEYLVKHHEPRLRALRVKSSAPKTAVTSERRSEWHRAPAAPPARDEWREEPIAVVGMSGRFPGSANVRELWENIVANRDLVGEVPADRWDWRQYYGDPRSSFGKTRVKSAGFMADVDCFDPLFFGISPAQAEAMDPQHRLLMESVWACIEDAGHRPSSLSGSKTGVFVGISTLDYQDLVRQAQGTSVTQGLFHYMVANRVSYFLNLHGPSEPFDTACSSSLVALHRAVGSIRLGECEAALVGGVNVMATPEITLGASQAGMLSEDGRCKTFDRSADGYGRGEGVAVLFLKPLRRAQADGDHIYGLIRGSAENHGGKATSPTAPNPLAQQELIAMAYTNAGIDARTVGYIDAHGTGTALGDPVELNGLKGAFAQLYAAQGITGPIEPHCGVGSLKTNIGHLEAAAGIAGVVKVLMMLQHGKIPGNPHLNEPNPYLQLEGSPFYLVKDTRDWPEMRDARGHTVPRRAAVSSFGVGGANAHVVLEQYLEPAREVSRAPTEEHPARIVLSAKSEDRLRAQAQQLLNEISNHACTERDLADIAYTLQFGRDAMDHRLAFTASSVRQLQERLRGYLEGKNEGLYAGESKRGKGSRSTLAIGDAEVLQQWVNGVNVDWSKLSVSGRRRSLPTYPFARERYWIAPSRVENAAPVLHPLLHRNTSDLNEQRFSSEFTGSEFFLRDHVVKGVKVLPGVAYLEMARAAVVASLGSAVTAGLRLRDVVWQRPLEVQERVHAHIRVLPRERGEVAFEIYTRPSDGEDIVHAQGLAAPMDATETHVDLAGLGAAATRDIAVESLYEAVAAAGIAFGPAHRGLTQIQVGAHGDGEPFVLARVQLPASVEETASRYELHPSVLDAALQASTGLAFADGESGPRRLALPFALESMDVLDRTPHTAMVYVRRSANTGADHLSRTDIDVCDELGRVCVRLRGFTSRVVEAESARSGISLFQPQWQPVEPRPAETAYDDKWVCVDETYRDHVAELRARHPGVHWEVLPRSGEGDEWGAAHLMAMAEPLLARLRTLLAAGPRTPVSLRVLVSESSGGGALRALSGMLKSAQLEEPLLHGQIIALPPHAGPDLLARAIEENTLHDAEIRYVEGRREVATLQPAEENTAAGLPWKNGGVYLITGGAGGLGRLFAEAIVDRVENARVILVGRSNLSEAQASQLRGLERRASEIRYRAVDVSDAAAVQRCIEEICTEYGRLDGVLHAAGQIQDAFIIHKSAEALRAVMAPKVLGAIHLDRATRGCDLDFLVLFSSGAGATGSVGQSDYATANAFLDRFAVHRNERVKRGERRGRTLSINWPLWADGGMRADEATRTAMRRQGLDVLGTAAGLEAFYRAWRSEASQVVVVAGTPTARLPAPVRESVPATDMGHDDLREKTIHYLKRLLATTLKLSPDRIDSHADLEQYGFDSILALRLVNDLEETFGPLPKTLMFQYRSIAAVAEYFVTDHRDALASKLKPAPLKHAPSKHAPLKRGAPASRRPSVGDPSSVDVAIIGMAGRYPQANTVHEYWQNLQSGHDCITEIPATRWDHSAYFDPQKGKPGKAYSKWGGFIDGVDEFDPLFFNISPQEAMYIDPQERLFLQCVYQTLEDAGYTREALRNVAVFVGVMYEEYQLYGAQAQALGQPYALPGNPASIANRVSYFCNFNGPSMAVDTMCSSSLTAIHLACESLTRGECDAAIAGGVNVSVHPNKYLMLSQGQFVSTHGRCASFGQGGDGYVPGEGVGAVLLKALARAVADGDHIYGVIKGTSINHGGKTNGYTVPNPGAQAQVIARALERSGVNPRAISYIEAHGTGTSLGDPIEISGLTQAFSQHTSDTQYCAIGSAKSNIGHLESAAGIAALTKVLLQMQHRTLVPSLHAGALNPHIDFQRTPFRVQQAREAWARPVLTIDGIAKEYPRMAGISSFGAGGSNAHLIVAEYDAPEATVQAADRPALIVLSAKTEERLQAHAKQLLEHLTRTSASDADLAGIAFTLQTGRDALEHRLAFTASTLRELEEKLTGYVQGKAARGDVAECYVGHTKQQREALSLFTEDEELQEAIRKWVQRGKYAKLLELWVKGLSFDWNSLYTETPRRVSLPAYPFSKERYWIEPPAARTSQAGTSALHPLVHANTSRLSEQRFSSTFTGTEFFLADHVVQGRRILPGVAYLEMALTAAEQSVDAPAERCVMIRDTAWLQPIAVAESQTVHVGLYPQDAGEIDYRIYSGQDVVHAQGRVSIEPASMAAVVDVGELRARCTRVMSSARCYELFDALGIAYGPSFRAIDSVFSGEGEALAKLQLPAALAQTADAYVLHPALLDAAIQASIGAVLASDGTPEPTLLFALDSLEVRQPCTEQAWAWIRRAGSGDGAIRKLDIDIFTPQGVSCVRMRGLAFRVLSNATRVPGEAGELMLAPRWEATQLPRSQQAWPAAGEPVAWIGGAADEHRALEQLYPQGRALPAIEQVPAAGALSHVFWIAPREASSEPHAAVLQGLRLLKALLHAGHGEKALGLTIVTRQAQGILRSERIEPDHAAVHGLIGSIAKEHPQWRFRVVDLPEDGAWPLQEIAHLPADPRGNPWAYRKGEWYREQWLPCERATQAAPSRFRQGGVYVMLGGAGRLGEALSEHVIRTHRAQLVWIGRRALDAEIQAKIDRLARLGPAPVYVQADATNLEDLSRAYQQIKQHHGSIHGLIHSTLVMSGSDLAHMDERRFAAGLGAKADVSVRMAQVFGEEPLDFVLFYSSIESFERSPRQSNYAAGSAFNDAFAHRLSKEWACPVKIMNWGYWGGGPIPDALQNWLDQAGFGLIEPERAMAALEELLAGPFTQLAFVCTTRPRALKGIELGHERVRRIATALPSLAQVLSFP
ncbi:SDR family NAD(P)-dependent oxidoreductase [Pendulispora brunnea]|uniref:SDR family NAD(P)-dependent oxidoreductase n=1 Tax=Pendulispora brunnea TaxID=2905690 RepID=A0ABZ2KIW6_9BACT